MTRGEPCLAARTADFFAALAIRAARAWSMRRSPFSQVLGHTLLTHGDFMEAIVELSRASRLDPTDASAHDELGNAYLAQQRAAEAIDQFREVVRLAPQRPEGHNNLGIALGSLGRFDEAIDAFRAALRADPGFSEAQANLKTALAVRQKK